MSNNTVTVKEAWMLILGVIVGGLAYAAYDSFHIYYGESGRIGFILVNAFIAFLILKFMLKGEKKNNVSMPEPSDGQMDELVTNKLKWMLQGFVKENSPVPLDGQSGYDWEFAIALLAYAQLLLQERLSKENERLSKQNIRLQYWLVIFTMLVIFIPPIITWILGRL